MFKTKNLKTNDFSKIFVIGPDEVEEKKNLFVTKHFSDDLVKNSITVSNDYLIFPKNFKFIYVILPEETSQENTKIWMNFYYNLLLVTKKVSLVTNI